jgi:hypothetical protein
VPAPAAKALKKAPKPEPVEEENPEAGGDFGLTLADPQPEAPEPPGSGNLDLDHAPPPRTPELTSVEGADGGFDFGDMGSGLEFESSAVEDDETPAAGFGAGMGLETGMQFASPSADFGGDDLRIEKPMSSFEAHSPPGWMEDPDTDDVMDFSAVAAEADTDEEPVSPAADVSARHRRTAKDRPSAPKFKSQRAMSGPIVSVVVLLALAVGGYYGWPIVNDMLGDRADPVLPTVAMPALAAELLPQMRSIGETAIADVVSQVNASTRVAGAPLEPDQAWLAGIYLGNASRYDRVAAFWSSIDDFMQGVRAADWQGYHDRYVERVGQSGLGADQAAQIVERADAGFVAAAAQRAQVYAEMETLVDAALALHDFLLANEARIEYRPAATSTADPVLEAVPNSPEIGDRMWNLVDQVTDALDAIGSLDRVTRERLTAALTTRLQQVGIR